MKKAALVILSLLILVYVAAIFVPFDPKERRPGTRLSGDLAEDQNPDWSFIEGRSAAYIETRTLYLIPHSITVSSWSKDGQLYVGCGNCDTKYWPKNVARDPRIRFKIDGEIYERNAIRLDDDQRHAAIGIEPDKPLQGTAVFRMDPR